MRRRLLLAASLVSLPLLACATMRVHSDYEPGAVGELEQYRAYAWLPEHSDDSPAPSQNPLVGERVRQAVDRELAGRGYRRVEPEQAEFMIGWHASLTNKIEVEEINAYYGYEWDPRFGPLGVGGTGYDEPEEIREFAQGTLILDVVDSQADRLVWRGVAYAEINPDTSPAERQKRINEAAHQILERFPPR